MTTEATIAAFKKTLYPIKKLAKTNGPATTPNPEVMKKWSTDIF